MITQQPSQFTEIITLYGRDILLADGEVLSQEIEINYPCLEVFNGEEPMGKMLNEANLEQRNAAIQAAAEALAMQWPGFFVTLFNPAVAQG